MKKQEVKRITAQIILFFKALRLVAFGVAKQLVLPSAKRKGNILSTVLLLFVSLTDLLAVFSQDLEIRRISQWKYYGPVCRMVRKSVLFTGMFLFLLSSFEWSCTTQLEPGSTISIAKTERRTAQCGAGMLTASAALFAGNKTLEATHVFACPGQTKYRPPHFPAADICLRNHHLRI